MNELTNLVPVALGTVVMFLAGLLFRFVERELDRLQKCISALETVQDTQGEKISNNNSEIIRLKEHCGLFQAS